tara:strand:+ start:198 stop:485 length:288 start_codon:yes stop_codon:yes gene_type:complete
MPENPVPGDILDQAKALVEGDRAETHGDALILHIRIAGLWSAYIAQGKSFVDAHDVAIMMALVKIARAKTGSHNPDDYIDMAGYAAIAGCLSNRE